jgi:nucleotide-binding universal stress UspA family protein
MEPRMAYKTILVQMNDELKAARVLEPAVALARRFTSHLVGLHVSPGLLYVPPLPSVGGIVGMIKEHERQVCDRIREAFEAATRAQGFQSEMRFLNPRGRDDLPGLVMQHARTADLIVASQVEPGFDATSVLDFPERLAVDSGRPVLMVPSAGVGHEIGSKVLVAWNGSREAARAVFDALPLLKGSKEVVVLGIEQVRSSGGSLPLPDTAIGATLARHGINVTVRTTSSGESSVGETILAEAIKEGADLIVMGAYGHTRLREFVFGGATRHMARNLTLPTFLAH